MKCNKCNVLLDNNTLKQVEHFLTVHRKEGDSYIENFKYRFEGEYIKEIRITSTNVNEVDVTGSDRKLSFWKGWFGASLVLLIVLLFIAVCF